MATITKVDPDQVKTSAANTAACLGELEGHLNGMSNAQDEMQVAVKGQTGAAIYKTMGEAYSKGKALAGTLNEIVVALKEHGVKIDASDLDAAGQVAAAQGGDGSVDSGSGWSNSSESKLDTKSW